jgi:fluoride exporter
MVLLLIALGGFAGAVARYRFGGWVYLRLGSAFPWGTLAVNLIGSFLLGALLPLLGTDAPAVGLHAFAAVGLLGAFTTFSTFALEAISLVDGGARVRAAAYVVLSLGLGLLAIVAGSVLSATWLR